MASLKSDVSNTPYPIKLILSYSLIKFVIQSAILWKRNSSSENRECYLPSFGGGGGVQMGNSLFNVMKSRKLE